MKENIKLGLLALIAVTLIVNTVVVSQKDAIDQKRLVNRPLNKATTPNNSIEPLTPEINTKPSAPLTSMVFQEMEHDFGNIKQDSENKKVFTFRNTGENPLIIERAQGSCGCTVPTYPTEPIAPGETGEIEVVYKPGKQKGTQQKNVTITANTQPTTTKLIIKAEVEEV